MKKIGAYVISVVRIVITALLWVATVIYLYNLLFKDYAMRNRTLLLFLSLGIVVLGVVFSMIIWRAYNFRRFGKRDRRKSASPATTEEIGCLFGLSKISVEKLRASPSLTLTVTKRYDSGSAMEYEVLTISGGGTMDRVSRPAVPQDFSVYTRAMGGRG